jgi:hypothetical protein
VSAVKNLSSLTSRVLFVLAAAAALLAIWEKVANLMGRTLVFLRGYTPSRLLELTAIGLLFVIVMQLRELKYGAAGGRGAN